MRFEPMEPTDHPFDSPRPPLKAWVMLFYLQILYILSVIDRYVLSMLAKPIKADMQLSDIQFSLVVGGPLVIFFALTALPLGWASDRYPRFRLIAMGVGLWTLCAGLTGVARNFGQLLLARLGLGAGEAVLSPAGYSLIPDIFPRRRVAMATALFSMSGMIGGASAFLVGGVLLHLFNAPSMIALAADIGVRPWQFIFLTLGVTGIPLALIGLFLRDPRPAPAGRHDEEANIKALIVHMRRHVRLYLCFLLGFGVASAIVAALLAWGVAYMQRSLGMAASSGGFVMGIAILVAALVAHPLIGWLNGRLFDRGVLDAPLRVFVVSLIVGSPITIGCFLVHSQLFFAIAMTLSYMMVTPYLVYGTSAIQLMTPARFRGKVVALFVLTTTIIGGGGGPLLVAIFTDSVFRDESKLGLSVAISVTIFVAISAVLLGLAWRPMRACVAALTDEHNTALKHAKGSF